MTPDFASVRPARPADRPALRRLQARLPERAPRLLASGLSTGGVLVSDAGGPVGYLLAVGVTFGRPGVGGTDGSLTLDGGDGSLTLDGGDGSLTLDGGDGSARPVPSAASDARASEAGGAHLAELVVAPGFRREGRATALLARLVAAADGPVTVAVHPENDAALALYRSLGFEETGRRETYFDAAPACWLVRR